MIHRGQRVLLREQGCCWLATYLSLWLAVGYLWLALFFPLICAPYYATSNTDFDPTTAFEHTFTPMSVVMSVPLDWSKLVVPEMTNTPAWLVDAQSTVTGLALTFINVLFKPRWIWLLWIAPPSSLALIQSERFRRLPLAPPERPPRLAPV